MSPLCPLVGVPLKRWPNILLVHVVKYEFLMEYLNRISAKSCGFFWGFVLFLKKLLSRSSQTFIGIAGADKSHCPTPGASAFSDRASEISLGACPWASDIS